MCRDYVGRCACACGCNAELERHTVVCSPGAGARATGEKENECGDGNGVPFRINYEVFDYRCRGCWPWSPASVSEWSRRRRGEHWWYVPYWKRRSLLDGPLPGICARKQVNSGEYNGAPFTGFLTNGDTLAPTGSDEYEAPIVAEDVVTQIYRHLESLYGDALGLGLTTIDELETYTKIRLGLATLRFPQALGEFI